MSVTPVETDPLWTTWRTLVAEFGIGRLYRHLSNSLSGMGIYGADVVSTLRKTPMAQGGMTVLAEVSDDLLLRLGELAALNAKRNEALWRMAALFYVSVPVTLLLAGLEGAPDIVKTVLSSSWVIVVGGAVMMTLWLLYYFTTQWRARQIEAVIELARIERGLSQGDFGGRGRSGV